MLPIDLDVLRVALHLLGASVWVGGPRTQAGIVPALRRHDAELTRVVARRFEALAWPAFGLTVVTGIWNLAEVQLSQRGTSYATTVAVKLLLVGTSAAGALLHSTRRGPVALALGGGLALLGALGALLLGVSLVR